MRYLRLGLLHSPSIAPQTSARQLELKARFVLALNLKQKSPPILPGERRKLDMVNTTAYLAGRPSG